MTATLHPLPLTRPLRGLRLGGAEPAPSAETLLAERERAGYERGRTDGQRELNEQLMRQRAELLDLQNGVLESLRQAMPQVLRDCEQALAALALEVAQKLVAGLPVSGEMVEAALREALEQVEETTAYHIYLPAEDLALLQQMNSERAYGAAESLKMDFSDYDRTPMFALNEIVWKSVKGADSPMPLPVRRFHFRQ